MSAQASTSPSASAAALYGPWGEPVFAFNYGPVGIGKSVDQVLLDPLGWTLGMPGCLKGAAWFVGPDLYRYVQQTILPANKLEDVEAYLDLMVDGKLERRNVKIDDWSVLANATLVDLKAAFPASHKYAMWDALGALIDRIKRKAATLGVHVSASAHESRPKTDEKGEFHFGGPDTGGRKAMKVIIAAAHLILRAEADPARWPYPAGYRCNNPDPQWTYKDRHNVVFGPAPMNLREILLAAGYTLPRFPGMEWLDDWAERVAGSVEAGKPKGAILEETAAALTSQGVYEGHAYWAVRDGLDRAELRRRRNPLSHALATLGSGGAPGVAQLPPPATTK